MTTFGTEARSSTPIGGVAVYLAGVAGLAFALTILWLSMRAVMGIGGACASGGPYVPAVECPDAVVLLTPVSIFVGLAAAGLMVWGGTRLSGAWAGLVSLAWPALFLGLGWNFLEFGLRPPGGEPGEVVWSWLFCGVVFFVMGGAPLAIAIWGALEVRRGGGRAAPWSGRSTLTMPRGRYEVSVVDRRRAGAAADEDLSRRLARLARLHAVGDLTDAEFEAARRAAIAEGDA